MKYMIASDIHGSAFYAERLVEACRRENPDQLVLLGDILYHGPRNDLPAEYNPKAVIALLNPLAPHIIAVRGNCDSEVDQMVLDFPLMADYAILPLGSSRVFLTHGHVYGGDNPPPMAKGDILLQGHTHVPVCRHTPGGWWLLNPGSVSIPKEGSPHGYMILEDNIFYWKTIDGDTWKTAPFGD